MINELVYPQNEEDLMTLLKETEGLMDFTDEGKYIEAVDNYNEVGRVIPFRKFEKFEYEDLFLEHKWINKDNFVKLLKSLPMVMLVNLNKIYFIDNEDFLDELIEKELSPNHTFDFNENIGMFVFYDNNILINLSLIRKLIQNEEKEDLELFGYYNKIEKINNSLTQTIVHEIYHSLQHNPLYEDKIPLGEEIAESYCVNFHSDFIIVNDSIFN